MVATVTASPDLFRLRVGITITGWAKDGPVTVYRSTLGTTLPVRVLPVVVGGSTFVWDYEAPFGVPVAYQVKDLTAGVVYSTPVTIACTDAMLRAPGQPALDVTIVVDTKPTVTFERAQTSLAVLGRRTPIVLAGVRSAPSFELTVRTHTDDEGLALVALLQLQATVLLLMPGARATRWCYVAIGQVVDAPVTGYAPADGSDPENIDAWSEWTLACQTVDAPVGNVVSDPASSWNTLVAGYATWDDVTAGFTTWLDLLASI